MTLTLNEIDPRQRLYLETTVHEASHAVAGVRLGATLRSAMAFDNRLVGVLGRTRFEPRDYPRERETEIAYSASYGQAKFRAGGHRRPTMREIDAVLRTTGHEDFGVLVAAGGTHTGTGVSLLIDRHWNAVIEIAKLLNKRGEVFHEDVCAALGITDGGGRTSLDISRLNSGATLAPVVAAAPPVGHRSLRAAMEP